MTQNNEREKLDVRYFNEKLRLVLEGLQNYTRSELSRELQRLSNTASPISQNEQQGAALKVYQGEICYKSQADDQSYGMWCPVGYDTTQLYKEGTEFFTAPSKQIPDGWISVEERLPENNEFVLAMEHDENVYKLRRKRGLDDFYDTSDYAYLAVTYWMPLPAPPTSLTSETNTEVVE